MTESTMQSLMHGIGVGSAQAVMQRAENPYYAKALRLNPNYDEALELRQQAILARSRHALSRPHAPLIPTTTNADLDGWLNAAAAAAAAETEWLAKDSALAKLIAHCESRIQGVGLDHDAVLQSLHADLNELMDRVAAAVERLGGARTPLEVIAADTGDAWNELQELHPEYETIRKAQDLAMSGSPEISMAASNYLWDDPLASDARIANLDEVFPHWRDQAPPSVVSLNRSWDGRAQPWPADPVGQLVWLATSGAKAWIPTIHDLNKLWEARRRRANGTPDIRTGRPDQPTTWQPINSEENTHV
jgi:hypothetical protein